MAVKMNNKQHKSDKSKITSSIDILVGYLNITEGPV